MNARVLGATARRILHQLAHDPRSIAMMLVLLIVLMTLLYYLFDSRQPLVSNILLVMLGQFPFIIMFLITSVAMLRERTSGTLERLMTTPVGKADLLFGYGIAFGIAAAVQGAVAAAFAYWVLGVDTPGAAGLTVLIAVGGGALGVSMGLVSSAFARTEFQAVQMFPVVVLPQALLCGLFVARDDMATWLRLLSDVMPLSYVVDALREIGAQPGVTGIWWRDVGIIAGCVLVALGLAAATLRRRTD
jgi:ABC-2 type transport system permease protein